MKHLEYSTRHGIRVTRDAVRLSFSRGSDRFLRDLDEHRGIYLSSGYEFPGRYSRWDVVTVCPPLEITCFKREVTLHPLNDRGAALNQMLAPVLAKHPHWEEFQEENGCLRGRLKCMPAIFPEEARSRQPSVFSILRELISEFRNDQDDKLALIGAFGYDLLFQFDPISLRLPREGRSEIHLYFCDEIVYVDRMHERIERFRWDFATAEATTHGRPRTGDRVPRAPARPEVPITSDHTQAEYMAGVEKVRGRMRQGDYYEVVLAQTFQTTYSGTVTDLFRRMQKANPSPYEFLVQLGDEQIVGASPEMFVRVIGDRVETCPIAGTARRTGDPIQDEMNIRQLLNSTKEESELTMCTDVDRNDKSRVCKPGSVKVIGRRLIESYAGLFHTVDHVEGFLQPGFDSIDAFLTHMWAVTLVGAPKKAASAAIEGIEKSARGWYGGAVGMLSLNGNVNTGILIRTTRLHDGYATYTAGATVLYDSDPAAEERETRLKANGFFRLLGPQVPAPAVAKPMPAAGIRLLLIDNDDCFIHTLANYARQAHAEVVTWRAGVALEKLEEARPDMILISPGPGRPSDFGVPQTVLRAAELGIPVFGVCLGLQGVVEAFGGELGVLGYPMHGKPSKVSHRNTGVFEGLPSVIEVGRYHSLYAIRERFPKVLEITAESEDGVIMGVRHRSLPIEAVQFHPESILTMGGQAGLHIIRNALRLASRGRAATTV